MKLTYFKPEEFPAHGIDGNGWDRMDDVLLIKLDTLRENCGFPFILTAAYRTKDWDIAQGRSGNSQHTVGKAVDIKVTDGIQRAKIIKEAIKLGFSGIGVHKDFVHVDTRRSELVVWPY